MPYFVYIVASKRNGTLYIGHTNDLARRIWKHKTGATTGFSKTHSIGRLVYYEPHDDIRLAQQRERSLKRWLRKWKLELIEKSNPNWADLYETLNS
jgi:putative endonuclease